MTKYQDNNKFSLQINFCPFAFANESNFSVSIEKITLTSSPQNEPSLKWQTNIHEIS